MSRLVLLRCFMVLLWGIGGMGVVQAQTIDDAGLWLVTLGQGKFDQAPPESPLRWWFDAQLRFLDDNDGFSQSLIRPGVGYAITEEQTLWAGYAWIVTSPIMGEDFDEHRCWQQWTYSTKAEEWSIVHRSRFEERWVETGDDTGLRWRQMVRGMRKLENDPRWSFIVWDEAFFHLNDTDWGAEAGFDQNRMFIGYGFKPHKDAKVRTEVGYLNQFINRPSRKDVMNHILSISFMF